VSISDASFHQWNVRKVEAVDLPTTAATTTTTDTVAVVLECLYFEPAWKESHQTNLDDHLARALEGRIVQSGTTMLLAALQGYVVAIVTDLKHKSQSLDASVAYRLQGCDAFCVQASAPQSIQMTVPDTIESPPPQDWEPDCPGYQSLLQELLSLVQLRTTAAPTGVLLTGCAGVGKTQLVSCLAGKCVAQGWVVHFTSLRDLLLRAAWATQEQMFQVLVPPTSDAKKNVLWIVDDLNILATNGSDGALNGLDVERRLVYNSLLQVMDKLVQQRILVLGLAHTSFQLSAELTKIGRLEKQVSMLPPTQRQRERILFHMLQGMNLNEQVCQRWEQILAPMTAGCVASDLRRICSNAQTRVWARTGKTSSSPSWQDMRECVRQCVPSQLATLDVTKGPSFVNECSLDDWPRIHELAWKDFAGYLTMKKRVYRTVVVPWRRHLKENSPEANPSSTMIPPSGVLFHGLSGNGKTFAARCLGASLALPMIKVRASDVLDKWLGGSEAAIRSLFSRARAAAPVILFFDEIDAIASNRATDGETSDVMTRLLSTLLNEMDGVSSGLQANVVVVACTNRLETLDAALLRPGRLEEHVHLEKPSSHDVESILKLRLSRAKLQDDINLVELAKRLASTGSSCADVEGFAREAVMLCLRRMSSSSSDVAVSMDDFSAAMDARMG
jgi:SpoVK/Ycf46/Vps4 family AAA+-type ATPase